MMKSDSTRFVEVHTLAHTRETEHYSSRLHMLLPSLSLSRTHSLWPLRGEIFFRFGFGITIFCTRTCRRSRVWIIHSLSHTHRGNEAEQRFHRRMSVCAVRQECVCVNGWAWWASYTPIESRSRRMKEERDRPHKTDRNFLCEREKKRINKTNSENFSLFLRENCLTFDWNSCRHRRHHLWHIRPCPLTLLYLWMRINK